MMYGGGMGFLGPLFMVVYLGVVIYFFYLLRQITASLNRIADKVEKIPVEKQIMPTDKGAT